MASTAVGRISGILAAVLVLAAVALAAAVAIVPALTGAAAYTVRTGSMAPALPPGTVVIVQPVAPDAVAIGDVVTFVAHEPGTAAARIVTHRVVGIDPGPVLRTRGDANPVPDPGGTVAADLRGRLWYSVPWVGLVSPVTGVLLGGGVLLALVAASALPGRARSASPR